MFQAVAKCSKEGKSTRVAAGCADATGWARTYETAEVLPEDAPSGGIDKFQPSYPQTTNTSACVGVTVAP